MMSESILPSASYHHGIDLSDIDFELVRRLGASGTAADVKKLKQIVTLLQDEPYPELLAEAKQTLQKLDPASVPISMKESRVSSEDQKEAFADLLNWAVDTKAKESQLRHGVSVSLPPVRGTAAASTAAPAASTTASTKKSKSNDTQQQQNSTLATKIKNKLGIDISALTSFEVAMVIRNEKEKGNECFKAKEYQESVDFYSNAIDIDTCLTSTSDNASATSDLTLYTNRALAYCKLKSWDQALVDCSSVLAVDMNNIKAYWRRATAYTGKVMHDKAIQDLKYALSLRPNNYLVELERALKRAENDLFEVEPTHSYVAHLLKERGAGGGAKKNTGKKENKTNARQDEKEEKEQTFKRMNIQEVQSDEEEEEEEEKVGDDEINIPKSTTTTTTTTTTTSAAATAPSGSNMKRIQIVETEDDDDEEEEVQVGSNQKSTTTASTTTTTTAPMKKMKIIEQDSEEEEADDEEALEEDEILSRQSRLENTAATITSGNNSKVAVSEECCQLTLLMQPFLTDLSTHLDTYKQANRVKSSKSLLTTFQSSSLKAASQSDRIYFLLTEITNLLNKIKSHVVTTATAASTSATVTVPISGPLSSYLTSDLLLLSSYTDNEISESISLLFYYRSLLLLYQEHFKASQAEINHAITLRQKNKNETNSTQDFHLYSRYVSFISSSALFVHLCGLKVSANSAVLQTRYTDALYTYSQAIEQTQTLNTNTTTQEQQQQPLIISSDENVSPFLLELQLRTNRSLCCLKLSQFKQAIIDTTHVIKCIESVKPNNNNNNSSSGSGNEISVTEWNKEYLPLKIKAHYRCLLSLLTPLEQIYLDTNTLSSTTTSTSTSTTTSAATTTPTSTSTDIAYLSEQLKQADVQMTALSIYTSTSTSNNTNGNNTTPLDLTKEKKIIDLLKSKLNNNKSSSASSSSDCTS